MKNPQTRKGCWVDRSVLGVLLFDGDGCGLKQYANGSAMLLIESYERNEKAHLGEISEGRSIILDLDDWCYHTYCTRPIFISTIKHLTYHSVKPPAYRIESSHGLSSDTTKREGKLFASHGDTGETDRQKIDSISSIHVPTLSVKFAG